MDDRIIQKFIESPIECAVALGIIILVIIVALIFFIKIIGNPISYVLSSFKYWLESALREIKGKVGATGVINLIICFLVFVLALVFFLRPSLLALFFPEDVSAAICGTIVLALAFLVFVISLRLVSDLDKMSELYRQHER